MREDGRQTTVGHHAYANRAGHESRRIRGNHEVSAAEQTKAAATRREANLRRAVALSALVVGALLAGLLISAAAAAVPAIPLVSLAVVLLIGRRLLDTPAEEPKAGASLN